ncbi:DUF389 domain-containing protein [Secundilactobacillus kimchicus]|nr:DUF389 domain-containing protein [Secundilactobacillus kimchicus]
MPAKNITDVSSFDRAMRDDLVLSPGNLGILFCAAMIASIGLNLNSPVVIIGAMLISPLMSPIQAIGYGLAISDSTLLGRALRLLGLEVVTSLVAASLYFLFSPINTPTAEILNRVQPTIWDVLIAILGGTAGIIAATKKNSINVVIGVAIATALMPPLCVAGFSIVHANWRYLGGSAYLFLINSFFIILATMSGSLIYNKANHIHSTVPSRFRWVISLIAVAMAVPSLITALVTVRQSYLDSQLQSFVDSEMSSIYVSKQSVDRNQRKISLFVVGSQVSSQEKQRLKKQLPSYHLTDYKLDITQLSAKKYVSIADLKKYFADNQQAAQDADSTQDKVQTAIADEVKKINKQVVVSFSDLKEEDDRVEVTIQTKQRLNAAQKKALQKAVKDAADQYSMTVQMTFTVSDK